MTAAGIGAALVAENTTTVATRVVMRPLRISDARIALTYSLVSSTASTLHTLSTVSEPVVFLSEDGRPRHIPTADHRSAQPLLVHFQTPHTGGLAVLGFPQRLEHRTI